jgi:hypothetical protein
MMDCPLEIPLLSASFAPPIPFHSVNAKRASSVPPLSFGIAHSQSASPGAGKTEKSARADFAGNSNEKNASARETKGFFDKVPKRFNHNNKDRSKVINDDLMTKFDS